MLDPDKPFFFGSGNDPAVFDQGCCGIAHIR
jgi:hypothetical protein